MKEKEIAEIRRQFRPEKSNITHIRGCYVNEKSEIVSEFNQSLGQMPQEESEKMLAILKRTLSGTLDKNLIEITFSTEQVVESDEHKLLMALRNSSLNDLEAVQTFFQRVIGTLTMEGNYLILLAQDTYDVPYRSTDGNKQEDASSEAFSYILCSICPVKMTKPALSYSVHENVFHNQQIDWIVAAPELGFMFPAFDDRSTNLYNALYYSKDITENHERFVDTVFHREAPLPAAVQKELFQSILEDTLDEDCSYQVIQAVHGQFCEAIEEHKADKEADPLVFSKDAVKRVLKSCGLDEFRMNLFDENYDSKFGAEVALSPRNIVDTKRIAVSTPDVTIYVSAGRGDLIETRVIDGKSYILVRVEEGVEVNGINVHIS